MPCRQAAANRDASMASAVARASAARRSSGSVEKNIHRKRASAATSKANAQARAATLPVGLGSEAERMSTVLADVLGKPGPTSHELDAMRGEETDQGVPYLALTAGVPEEAVTTMTGVDEPVARRHRRDAMTEEAAGIPHFLGEHVASGEAIGIGRKHQGMSAPHAHVCYPVAIRQPYGSVMAEENRTLCDGRAWWRRLRAGTPAPHRQCRARPDVRLKTSLLTT